MKQRIIEFLASALLTVTALAATVIAADIGMRSVGFKPSISHHWFLQSGSSSRVANKDLIMIRPEFLEADHYAVDQTRKTIVTIGDSFTEGYPVSAKYYYPTAMKRLLLNQGCDVNLINMGIGNSGPDQHLRLMRKFVLPKLKPDIVVWQFYSNDISDNIRQALFDIQEDVLVPLAGRHWIYVRQKIYDYIPLPNSVKADSPVVNLLFSGLEAFGDRRIPGGSSSQLSAWSMRKIRLAVEEMDRLSKIHDFAVYYALIAPQSNYLLDSDEMTEASGKAITPSKQLHRILLNRPDFINAWFGDVRAQPRDVDFKMPASVVAKSSIFADGSRDGGRLGERHFNEIGYQLLAEIVADHAVEQCLE